MADLSAMPAPYRLAAEKYGGLLLIEEGTVTVLTTVTEVAGGDPERVNLLLINLSSNAIFVAPRSTVSLTRGILLEANGGALVLDAELDGILPSMQWLGISNLASGTLYRITQRRTVAIAP